MIIFFSTWSQQQTVCSLTGETQGKKPLTSLSHRLNSCIHVYFEHISLSVNTVYPQSQSSSSEQWFMGRPLRSGHIFIHTEISSGQIKKPQHTHESLKRDDYSFTRNPPEPADSSQPNTLRWICFCLHPNSCRTRVIPIRRSCSLCLCWKWNIRMLTC